MSTTSLYLLLLLAWPLSTYAVSRSVTPAHAAAAVPVSSNISFPTAEPRAGQPLNASVSFKRRSDQLIPTTSFLKSHEQLLHMVGVGEDLDTFFHWHPSPMYRQAFSLQRVVFPKAGAYLVALDGLLAEGPLASSAEVMVGGSPRMDPAATTPTAAVGTNTVVTVRSLPLQRQQPAVSLKSLVVPTGSNKVAEERGSNSSRLYTLTLVGPQGIACNPGVPATYTWTLSHGSSNKGSSSTSQPVRDLVLYYGAPMHLAVVRSDLGDIQHVHGDVASPAGTTSTSTAGTAAAQYPVTVDTTYRPGAGSQAAPAGRTGDHAAMGNHADMGEHSGHGHRRRLLQSSRQVSGNSLTQLLDRIGNALDERLYEAGIIEPKGSAMPSQGSAQPAAHSGHAGTHAMNASGSAGFGPALKTQVVFPTAGRYCWLVRCLGAMS